MPTDVWANDIDHTGNLVGLLTDDYGSGTTDLQFYDAESGTSLGGLSPLPGGTVDIALLSSGPDWLTVDSASGTLGAGTETNIALTINATELTQGSHTGRVTLSGNDPGEPSTNVAVRVRVVDVPGYSLWRTNDLGAGASGGGYLDDLDGDTKYNILEFLGKGGVGPDGSLLTPLAGTAGDYRVEMIWRKGTADSLLLIQACEDLSQGQWLTLLEGSGYTVISREDVDADYERVVLSFSSQVLSVYLRFVAAL
jgi:hypothetical protein